MPLAKGYSPSIEPEELKHLLTDAEGLFLQLGIDFKKETVGYKILCPIHQEKTPSCSVRTGKDGTLAVKCFGCGFGGNILHLIAANSRLDIKKDFPKVKTIACELASKTSIQTEKISIRREGMSAFQEESYHFFAEYLLKNYPAEKDSEAKSYLERRSLGFLAHQWGCLPKHPRDLALLRNQVISNIGEKAWYHSGMAYKGEQVITWPKHRLLIPWITPQGKIQALQRRSLEALVADEPKYIFPSTRFVPLVHYPFCRDWAFLKNPESPIGICEGAFDSISFEGLHKFKIPALGIPGVNSINYSWEEFVKNRVVIIALNNDLAGKEKTLFLEGECKMRGAKEIKIGVPTYKDFNEDLVRGVDKAGAL